MTPSASFVQEARHAATRWKANTPTLPHAARAPGSYRQFPSLPFCLPAEYAVDNLLPEARTVALSRFAAAGIPWHHGINGGPSNHLLSSQVQCVNALAPFVDRPDALAAIFGSVLTVAEVLPFGAAASGQAHISPFDATDHVVFEWQGLTNHLNEWVGTPTRGSRATSTDAAIRYRAHDGSIEIALIEWKYTERYPTGTLSGSSTSQQTRLARYQALFDAGDGPIDTTKITLDDLLVEPVYQLARMALLARSIETARELDADKVRVVYVAPERNALLWASPGSRAFAALAAEHSHRLDATWRNLLREPDRFVVLDSGTLINPASPTSTEFKQRYAHLADPADDQANPDGEQREWGRALPGTYQVLTGLTALETMPKAPRGGDAANIAATYWTPLLHLLLYSFAWTNPAKGMRSLSDTDHIDDDPLLTLISNIWADSGQLDWFTAWLCDGPLTDGVNLHDNPDSELNLVPVDPDPEWLTGCRHEAERAGIPTPYSDGGRDPLHLSFHCNAPLAAPTSPCHLETHAIDMATLTLTQFTGWYRAISQTADQRWPSRPTTATIHVHINGIGVLGTYHQSPNTGLWTSASESIHVLGNN